MNVDVDLQLAGQCAEVVSQDPLAGIASARLLLGGAQMTLALTLSPAAEKALNDAKASIDLVLAELGLEPEVVDGLEWQIHALRVTDPRPQLRVLPARCGATCAGTVAYECSRESGHEGVHHWAEARR